MGNAVFNGDCMSCLKISQEEKFGITNEQEDSGLKHYHRSASRKTYRLSIRQKCILIFLNPYDIDGIGR